MDNKDDVDININDNDSYDHYNNNNTTTIPISWKVASSLNASCLLIASCCCFFFLYALLSTSETRSNSYNIYVVFLIIPDALNTMITSIKSFLIVSNNGNRFFPLYFYETFMIVWMFYFNANFYLNAVITYEINTLVNDCYQRRKRPPPQLRKIYQQALIVYLFAILVAFWYVLQVPWSPYHFIDVRRGDGAFGSPPGPDGIFGKISAMAISMAIVLIPVVYVMYVKIQLWRKQLLPRSGKTRCLSLFFMRIIVVFLALYVPNVTLSIVRVAIQDTTSPEFYWLDEAGGLVSAVQAFVTLYMMSLKDDIFQALRDKTFSGSHSFKSSWIMRASHLIKSSTTTNATAFGSMDLEAQPEQTTMTSEWDKPDVYALEELSEAKGSESEQRERLGNISADLEVQPE